ncbi:hypothetical protein [uncultured Serinicoccus sp.]|uniref:hypothetical protein n=1 Tax=uncultured Serinicoccus sp. TaxID=735514 RepID=UPI00262567B4|nr:hypothetical protein [uncultured Serinicoccus sp.]
MGSTEFISDTDEGATGGASRALRDALGSAGKGIAVLDAEDVHEHDLVHLLRGTRLQVVLVLRSAFGRGLETALAMAEALAHADGSGVRVLAATWGDHRFPSVALVSERTSHEAYSLVIARSGTSQSLLDFTALMGVDQDVAASVDEWFMRVWELSTELERIQELEQPVFERADPEVVAKIATRWRLFVDGVQAGHDLQPEGDGTILDVDDERDRPMIAGADPAPWALFPIKVPGMSVDLQKEPSGAAQAAPAGARASILAVRPVDPLERDLRDIYARGSLVSLHTSHKVPTFRFDVNAVLGISERAQSGTASLRSPIRLDLLPAAVSVEIGRSKRFASNVLQSHSIVLAENQHWMPLGAMQHFEAVLEVKAEPRKVSQLLGRSIADHVRENLPGYVDSLRQVFTKQQIRYEFDVEAIERLGAAIETYLDTHESLSVTSSYTTEVLGYSGVRNDDYTRPFTLLLKVAKTGRRRVMAGDSGRRVIPAPPVGVWDIVGGDGLLTSSGKSAWVSARKQLDQIERIEDSGASAEMCQALIDLMRSDPGRTLPSSG